MCSPVPSVRQAKQNISQKCSRELLERLGFLAEISHRWNQFRAIFISEEFHQFELSTPPIPARARPCAPQKQMRVTAQKQTQATFDVGAGNSSGSIFCRNGIRLPSVGSELSYFFKDFGGGRGASFAEVTTC